MSIAGDFCHCIESALRRNPVPERKLPGANCCRFCQGIGCNSPKHPGILARPLAKRLQRAPYCLSGPRAARRARDIARREAVRHLAEVKPAFPAAVMGHCSRCSRYLPLRPEDRRCAYCDRP